MTGTLLNVAAVLVGTTIGLALGNRLPERVRGTVMQALGLVTLLIGAQMALQTRNVLILLASLAVGGALGEVVGIEARLDALGRWLERCFSSRAVDDALVSSTSFVRGFVTSSLVFCVGPLTILGAFQDGLSGDIRLLAVKSLLDGLAAIAFASTLGAGVYFSTLVILVYQGGIALIGRMLGTAVGEIATSAPVQEMTAAGGLLILGIGLRLLEIKEVRVGNLLPAVALAPLLTLWFGPALDQLLGGA